ncbi:MAG: transglutaminase-like domain-containing protein [Planctomycetota bacterium]
MMRILYFVGILSVLMAAAGCKKKAEPVLEEPVSIEEDYFAVFMEGKKVGYAMHTRKATAEQVVTTDKVNMTITRARVPVTMTATETSIETTDGKPLGFEAEQDYSMMTMQVVGAVNEPGTVDVTVTLMGAERKSTLEWPSGALMAEGLRLLTLRKGLKEGLSYSAKMFSPGIMQALDARIRIGPKRNVNLLGRVVALTEVTTAMTMPMAGEIVSTGYVDDELRVQKTIMPIMGMKIEMVACEKEFALSENDVLELINKMFVASPKPLEKIGSTKSISYQLSPMGDANSLTLPSCDNQTVRPGKDDGVIVIVEPVAAPKGARFPYKGKDRTILEAMEPTRYLQSDNEQIIKLARRAIGHTKDAGEAVNRIEAFVGDYIDNKSLSIGYASAVEVADSKQGDCSEAAVLTAAMCRAIGIPAKVASGVAYVEDFAGIQGFGGHAWVEVYVGGKWVGLDAAFKGTGRGGYDAGHIAMAIGNGNPEDFFSLINIIGQFKIDEVTVTEK